MKEEFDAIAKIHKWDLVDLPPRISIIRCTLVYNIKTYSVLLSGTRPVLWPKSSHNRFGIGHKEIFTVVACLLFVCTLTIVIAFQHWPLFLMDVRNVFLNFYRSEDVYIQPPLDLSHSPIRTVIFFGCCMDSSRQLWLSFSPWVLPSSYDSALFIFRTSYNTILLLLYIDNKIINGDDSDGNKELK